MTVRGDELFVDTRNAPWLDDHRPDYGAAVIPMTFLMEIVAATARASAPSRVVVGLRNVSVRSFVVVGAEPLRIRRRSEAMSDGTIAVTLLCWRDAARAELSREEPVAYGEVVLADTFPMPLPDAPAPLRAPQPWHDLYESGALFHGPAFQLMRQLELSPDGASALLDFGATQAPRGILHPVALDAAQHCLAAGRWREWCPEVQVPSGKVIPLILTEAHFYGPPPERGVGRAEMRPRGADGASRRPRCEFFIFGPAGIWAVIRIVYAVVPAGPLDAFPARDRRSFLRDRAYHAGVRVSSLDGDATVLTDEVLALANWVPRTIQIAYEITDAGDITLEVARREHAAHLLQVHPADVTFAGDEARSAARPGVTVRVTARRRGGEVRVDTAPVRS
jgi:hypothetical protein